MCYLSCWSSWAKVEKLKKKIFLIFRGPQGERGMSGEQGISGDQGPPGKSGIDGPHGRVKNLIFLLKFQNNLNIFLTQRKDLQEI